MDAVKLEQIIDVEDYMTIDELAAVRRFAASSEYCQDGECFDALDKLDKLIEAIKHRG